MHMLSVMESQAWFLSQSIRNTTTYVCVQRIVLLQPLECTQHHRETHQLGLGCFWTDEDSEMGVAWQRLCNVPDGAFSWRRQQHHCTCYAGFDDDPLITHYHLADRVPPTPIIVVLRPPASSMRIICRMGRMSCTRHFSIQLRSSSSFGTYVNSIILIIQSWIPKPSPPILDT